MRPILTTLTLAAAVTLGSGSANAAVLYQNSLEYGTTTGLWKDNAAANADFPNTSARNTYEATGLTHANLNTAGGNYAYIFNGGGQGVVDTISVDPGFTSGATYWMAGLLQWGGTGSTAVMTFTNASSVNSVGFSISSAGTVNAIGSINGGAATTNVTGETATAGVTHLMVMRGTVGAGTSPTDSVLDFWFDPADVFNLGVADWTTGTTSKFGRQGYNYTGVNMSGSSTSTSIVPRVDELNFATDFNEVFVTIPEPASLALLGLGGLCMLGVRHKR